MGELDSNPVFVEISKTFNEAKELALKGELRLAEQKYNEALKLFKIKKNLLSKYEIYDIEDWQRVFPHIFMMRGRFSRAIRYLDIINVFPARNSDSVLRNIKLAYKELETIFKLTRKEERTRMGSFFHPFYSHLKLILNRLYNDIKNAYSEYATDPMHFDIKLLKIAALRYHVLIGISKILGTSNKFIPPYYKEESIDRLYNGIRNKSYNLVTKDLNFKELFVKEYKKLYRRNPF